MPWIVGFINEEVQASLDAFPLDIRASFQRSVELIQLTRTGAGARALCEAPGGAGLGNATQGQERYRPRLLCDSGW